MGVTFLFVGERPSPTAFRTGATWESGRLAAKQLHDALRSCGLNPADHRYDNVFVCDPVGPEVVCPRAVRRIRRLAARGLIVVAMGHKARSVLDARRVPCIEIVHPAARGRIRKKELYASHVLAAIMESYRGTRQPEQPVRPVD